MLKEGQQVRKVFWRFWPLSLPGFWQCGSEARRSIHRLSMLRPLTRRRRKSPPTPGPKPQPGIPGDQQNFYPGDPMKEPLPHDVQPWVGCPHGPRPITPRRRTHGQTQNPLQSPTRLGEDPFFIAPPSWRGRATVGGGVGEFSPPSQRDGEKCNTPPPNSPRCSITAV